MRYMLLFIVTLTTLSADQTYYTALGDEIRIHVVRSSYEIDCKKAQAILVRSFMAGYEDVTLVELNPSFQSIGDVRRFYEDYFHEELESYSIWVEAYLNGELAGWATFELEKEDEAYMNLLCVDPKFQRRDVGKYLTFSIFSDELYPNVQAIKEALINSVIPSSECFHPINQKTVRTLLSRVCDLTVF